MEKRDDYLNISQEDLKKLNEAIDKVINEKKDFDVVNWDFIQEAVLFYCNNYKFKDPKKEKEIILKKFEIVLIALDFFKSIDRDFHRRVLKIVFGKYDKAEFTYFKRSEIKDFDEMDDVPGFEKFKKYMDMPCNYELNNKIKINMAILCGWTYNEKLSKELEKDEGTIEDLYALVHELAHTLELNLDDNEDKKDIINHYGDFFCESTAIGFEKALTSYLLKKGITKSVQDSKGYYIERECDTLNKCIFVYLKLALADLKEKNGIITAKGFNEIFNNLSLEIPIKEMTLWGLLKDSRENRKMYIDVRYAFSGAIAPRIEELILRGDIDRIKKYIEFTKLDAFKEPMEALGITLDMNGIKLVEEGILRSVSELEMRGEER